nr:hypothetical protein PJ912_22620 [Pectobacterium colocasium]
MSQERKNHYKELVNQHIKNEMAFFEIVELTNLSGIGIRKFKD